MKPLKIISSKVWINRVTGETASIYGCLPYESPNWELFTRGYTTFNDNGTVGNGQKPFKTLAEAQEKYPDLEVSL